jgi:hypothetical protein
MRIFGVVLSHTSQYWAIKIMNATADGHESTATTRPLLGSVPTRLRILRATRVLTYYKKTTPHDPAIRNRLWNSTQTAANQLRQVPASLVWLPPVVGRLLVTPGLQHLGFLEEACPTEAIKDLNFKGRLLSAYVVTICFVFGSYLVIIWLLSGYYLVIIWLLNKCNTGIPPSWLLHRRGGLGFRVTRGMILCKTGSVRISSPGALSETISTIFRHILRYELVQY